MTHLQFLLPGLTLAVTLCMEKLVPLACCCGLDCCLGAISTLRLASAPLRSLARFGVDIHYDTPTVSLTRVNFSSYTQYGITCTLGMLRRTGLLLRSHQYTLPILNFVEILGQVGNVYIITHYNSLTYQG